MTDLARLHAQLDRIEAHIADIKQHGASVSVTLAEQHIQLKDHIRRTALLEQEIKPISKHVQRVQGGFAVIIALSGIIAGVAWLWSK